MTREVPEKGIFDQLAEYLVQNPPRSDEPEQHAAAATDVKDDAVTVRPEEEVVDPFAGAGQTFEFAETAEKLVVEKEVVVREELVVRKLGGERTEAPRVIEAERLEPVAPAPEEQPVVEAERIEPVAPEPVPEAVVIAMPVVEDETPLLDAPAPVPLLEDAGAGIASLPAATEPVTVEAEPVEAAPAQAAAPVEAAPVQAAPGPEPQPQQPVYVFGGKPDAAVEPPPRRPQPAAPPAPAARPKRADKSERSGWWMAWLAVLFVLAGAVAFYFGKLLGTLYTGS